MPTRLVWLVAWLAGITLLGIAAQFLVAWLVLSPPETDSPAFMPAAVYFAQTGRLDNPIYKLAYYADPLNGNRFLYHGPLFPWLVGLLARFPTPRAAFVVLAFFRAIALLLTAAAFICLFSSSGRRLSNRSFACLAVIAASFMVAEAGMHLPIVGRPELLGEVFVAAASLVFICLPSQAAFPVIAICTGLLGATHLLGALTLAAATFLLISWRFAPRQALPMIAITGAVCVALTAIILAVSPNGLADTLHGQTIQAKLLLASQGGGLRDVVSYLFLQWDDFFFFAFVILLAVLVVSVRRELVLPGRHAWLSWPLSLMLLCAIWFEALRLPRTAYNLAMFSPAVFIALLKLQMDAAAVHRRAVAIAGAAALLCAAISSLALIKRGTDIAAALRAGSTYDHARDIVRRAIPNQGCVLVDYRSWPLFDDYARMRHIDPGSDLDRTRSDVLACRPGEPRLALLLRLPSQDCSAWGHADGLEMIVDARTPVRPTILGHPTSKFPAGYGVCITRQAG